MPRPVQHMITFSIDGREVTAPQNTMLVDAAKFGDVEIPVFCYEPKLGGPVGACRMCLVEVEGIPKLQAGCATPVKDGMVVHTQTQKVKAAQQSIVEFLLVNHPLDCPVCDKGGECPLQDISFGWGGGRSRFIEPKRHFVKPLALSPLIAIDRERCILCYRCVRFSQEVSEDYQLVFQERGADAFVATFNGHPYVAPFSGNIIELCPVGALTSQPYRFRARPWDIEQAGTVCTLCPAQCNISATVRDERVLRVLARQNDGVDDGWLCDKGRFAYQAIHAEERITQPMVRDGGNLRPVSWERALDEAAQGLSRARGRVGAIVGGETSNEEAFLLGRILREALDSEDVDCRPAGGPSSVVRTALGATGLQAAMADVEWASAVLVVDCEPVDDMPILDLRIRKAVRRHKTKLVVATSRPSSLDPNAAATVRFAPGGGEAFVVALDAALSLRPFDEAAAAAGADPAAVRALANVLRRAGQDVVIVWGERLTQGAGADNAGRALLNIATRLAIADRECAGLLEVPSGANGRGLREVGALPADDARDAPAIGAAAAAGDITALYLLHTDPLRTHPDRATWEQALDKASTIVAHAAFLTEGIRDHATVVFPAESHAEKEGTVVHPDGRVQRLRRAIGRQGDTRPEWSVLADLAKRVGLDAGALTGPMVTAQMMAAISHFAGLTLDEIGAKGVRWTEREAAANYPPAGTETFELDAPAAAPAADGQLLLGTFRSIWASPEVEASPALKFLHPRQRIEISPEDARRLALSPGEHVIVGTNGTSVSATVTVRADAPDGTVFLEEAIPGADAANVLRGPHVEVRKA